MKKVKVGGWKVEVDALTLPETLHRLQSLLTENHAHRVLTLNSEMLSAAARDEKLLPLLQNTAVTLCDGRGVMRLVDLEKIKSKHFLQNTWRLLKLTTQSVLEGETYESAIPERLSGIDVAEAMMQDSVLGKKNFFLLGGRGGTAQRAKKKLQERFPELQIVGTEEEIEFGSSASNLNSLIEKIQNLQAEIVLVALGFPKQEIWIEQHMSQLSAKILMGVGGAFDVWAEKIPRAPQTWQKHGLEWLWRLLQEPQRLRRIYNATIDVSCLALQRATQEVKEKNKT